MSLAIFAIVLCAAALHATWNAIVKSGSDKLLTVALVTSSAALVAIAALPLLPAPARPSWAFIGASAVLQIVYFALVGRIYHVADMSQTYPLMRGAAPLIVAFAGVPLLGEPLTPTAWLGIGVICAGILSLSVGGRAARGAGGLGLAMLNAVVIATYTLVDGAGVRLSGAPASYTLWIFLLTGLPLAVWAFTARRHTFARYAAANWHLGFVGGVGTVASYGLALWAMTEAPIAVVAALRETSILFGAAIAGIVLRERLGWVTIAAVCIIALGAAVLRLA